MLYHFLSSLCLSSRAAPKLRLKDSLHCLSPFLFSVLLHYWTSIGLCTPLLCHLISPFSWNKETHSSLRYQEHPPKRCPSLLLPFKTTPFLLFLDPTTLYTGLASMINSYWLLHYSSSSVPRSLSRPSSSRAFLASPKYLEGLGLGCLAPRFEWLLGSLRC